MALAYQRWVIDPQEEAVYRGPYPPEPCPNAMQTSVTMDRGVYEGCQPSRSADASLTEKYNQDYEYDFGQHSCEAESEINVEGISLITPPLKDKTYGNHQLKLNIYCKLHSNVHSDPLLSCRLYVAIYKWDVNDSLAAMWANAKSGGYIVNTTYTLHTVTQSFFMGHNYNDGDRICFDCWITCYNEKLIGVDTRWAYLHFGNTNPTNIESTFNAGFEMMPILQPLQGSEVGGL